MGPGRGTGKALGREVILAFVVERSGTTSNLERRFRQRFPWYSHSMVRETLKILRGTGAVRAEPRTHPGKRQQQFWEATDAGAEQFRAWLSAPLASPLSREELYAKLAFCRDEDVDRFLEIVQDGVAVCRERLKELAKRGAPSPPLRRFGVISRRAESGMLEADIAWLDRVEDDLRNPDYNLH
jgi:DNA-binding PadR family transcriptional regulator